MNEREMLMRRLSSAQFAAWELHIYLDTHPDDSDALAAMKKYDDRTAQLIREYETKFGPIRAAASLGEHRFAWVNNPWPWETEGQ